MQAAAIILAGGKNSRMSRNKAFMRIGERSIIEGIIERVKPLVEKVIVVTNSPDEYSNLGAEVITDVIPGRGPLSGIHAGLLASPYRYNLIIACDMPFVSRELGEVLLEAAIGHDAAVVRIGGRPQPLFAVYSSGCLQPIERLLREEKNKCTAFYPEIDILYLDAESTALGVDLEEAYLNVNTPEEYENAITLAEIKRRDR
ncbi:MAG: molybdenum cofactor guanylyltransferase [Firmicutes bacterium]|nr:molybdenum cofactor guanylyltransferase [Bacillota bacterium]